MATRPYRARPSRSRSQETRRKIVEAVREMLAEGSFHDASVDQVGERAGVSRATVYQHFGSRLDLIDSVCDVMGVNPALVELRNVIGLPDAGEALTKTLANTVRFWSSESGVARALYGVVEV